MALRFIIIFLCLYSQTAKAEQIYKADLLEAIQDANAKVHYVPTDCPACSNRFRYWMVRSSPFFAIAMKNKQCEARGDASATAMSAAEVAQTLQQNPSYALSPSAYNGIVACASQVTANDVGRYFSAMSDFDSAATRKLDQLYAQDSILNSKPLASIDCNQFSNLKTTKEHCEQLKTCNTRTKLDQTIAETSQAANELKEDEAALTRFRDDQENLNTINNDINTGLSNWSKADIAKEEDLTKKIDLAEADIAKINAQYPWLNGNTFKEYLKKSPTSVGGAIQAQFAQDRTNTISSLKDYTAAAQCLSSPGDIDALVGSCSDRKLDHLLDEAPIQFSAATNPASRGASRYFEYGQCVDDARHLAKDMSAKFTSAAFFAISAATVPFTAGLSLEADGLLAGSRLLSQAAQTATRTSQFLRATPFATYGGASLLSGSADLAFLANVTNDAYNICHDEVRAVTEWRSNPASNSVCLSEKESEKGTAIVQAAHACLRKSLRAGLAFAQPVLSVLTKTPIAQNLIAARRTTTAAKNIEGIVPEEAVEAQAASIAVSSESRKINIPPICDDCPALTYTANSSQHGIAHIATSDFDQIDLEKIKDLSSEQKLKIAREALTMARDRFSTTVFPKGTNIEDILKSFKKNGWVEKPANTEGRRIFRGEADLNGKKFEVDVAFCSAPKCVNKSDNLVYEQGQVITVFPHCGPGVVMIPWASKLQDYLDGKKLWSETRFKAVPCK
jgi:hypothetical protein